MKIESLQTRVVRKAFAKAQWNPRTRWTENVVVLVLLRAEGGLLGLGEAYCDGGAPDSVQAIIERDLRRWWWAGLSSTWVHCHR